MNCCCFCATKQVFLKTATFQFLAELILTFCAIETILDSVYIKDVLHLAVNDAALLSVNKQFPRGY